ncbi:DUF11 domain-containing protein [bacterium]|jgi:hypothetical protein|nr:DUF11 domain-containing protein [bacterium]MBT4648754.1 DUF11 domain-containing protein [bacterium]
MAKVKKRSVDSVKRSPVRKNSYEAPIVTRRKSSGRKREVPKEFRTFKKAPKARGGLIFFLFLIFIAAAAGLWHWNGNMNGENQTSLQFQATGPAKITSGDEVTYVVEYTNLDTVPLTNMELSVYWPVGFYFDQATIEPDNANAKTWTLTDLEPGRTATIEIVGQLVGAKDEELTVSFNLDYQPANFHSDFRAKDTVETKVKDQKIELAIETADKTLIDTEQEIKIVYRNLSKEALVDISLDVLLPDDWITASTTPAKEGDFWTSSLEPEEEKIVVIKGNFSIDSRVDQLVVAEIGKVVNDDFRRLSRQEHAVIVVNPQFSIDLEINGNSGNITADWDDTLRYQLKITNDSASDIADVQIAALLTGDLLSWDTLDTVGEYLGEKIIWTTEVDDALTLWTSGETKTFTWEVKLIDQPQPERLIENIIMINVAGLSDWEQLQTISQITVGESLGFNNGVYWHLGGRRVGSGLLPPQVGETTGYLVVWSLPQSTGDFDTVTVSTILPPNVSFADEAEVEEGGLVFDEDDRSITWTLDAFGDLLLPVTTSFMIDLVPTEDDRGQTMTLLNPVTAKAVGQQEEVIVRSKILKTSDAVADSSEPIGTVQ